MFEEQIKESINTKQKLLSPEFLKSLESACFSIFSSLVTGSKLLICGNGGSAADAQHLSAELLNRFETEREPLPAIALTTDTSTLTAIGNDYKFKQIFSKQIKALGKEDDCLLAITTSGNSDNILEAILAAQQKKMTVILLTGKDGGKAARILKEKDIEVIVPSNKTSRIQESHLLVIHCLCQYIDTKVEAYSQTESSYQNE